jgi:hypothetical protein
MANQWHFRPGDANLAHLAVFMLKGNVETPAQVSGYMAARTRGLATAPTANLRKQAAALYAIGPVLHHNDLYEPHRMDAVLRTEAHTDPNSGAYYPKGSIKSIKPVYGALKTTADGSSILDRALTNDELLRVLFSAAALGKELGPVSQLGRPFGQIVDRLRQMLTDGDPLTDFDIAQSNISDAFKKMTVRHFLDSPINRALLPFKRYAAVLGDHDAHTAGCIRCLRTLHEPKDFYSVDTARTAQMNLAFDAQTPLSLSMLNRMKNYPADSPWYKFARDRTPFTQMQIQLLNQSDAIVFDASQQLIEVPSRLLFSTDD